MQISFYHIASSVMGVKETKSTTSAAQQRFPEYFLRLFLNLDGERSSFLVAPSCSLVQNLIILRYRHHYLHYLHFLHFLHRRMKAYPSNWDKLALLD